MSYRFTVPAEQGASCTAETFDDTAEQVLTDYLSTWTDGDQKAATRRAAEQALELVAAAVDPPGIVGDHFAVTISGHANLTPGKPTGNWTQDFVTIQIQGIAAPSADDTSRLDAPMSSAEASTGQ